MYDNLRIVLPESIFSNLFAFLASYNFTVDENDPDDAEIGVDPEMLGKIFESLLEDNKAKGAFYTPKEIVRYMCKEALIAYLQSIAEDEPAKDSIRQFVTHHDASFLGSIASPLRGRLEGALVSVKICDPAIGSGAFPMGLLNELWRCREALRTELSRLQLKKEIIENNIYGVDIERGAIDIARLRFWLSIVVDSEKAEPLPNFDYKFMQGNSLIESYGGFDLSRIAGKTVGRPSTSTQYVIGLDSDLSQKNLQRLLREYFSVTD
ncbi:MAG: DNA modification methylase, partial [Bacteroidaceae bacterium]|nr:DNA modification methylase [Bacteroidaceae bacterium]